MQRRSFTTAFLYLATAFAGLKSRSWGEARRNQALPAPQGADVPDLGLNADLRQQMLLQNSEWYHDISAAPVHPQSATYLATLGKQNYSQDAGGWLYHGAIMGIPYFVVAGNQQPFVPVVCSQYLSESDLSYAPIPLRDDIVEGFPANALFPTLPADSDRHVLVIDRDQRVIYELYKAYRRGDHWYCSNMAIWDMDGGDLQRPTGETSADVAGMSVMAGLMLGHQVVRDSIDHAFRFTIQHPCPNYLAPPSSHAGGYGNAHALPFGGRVRLKASVSETHRPDGGRWNADALKIIRALKRFGMINADTGLALSSQGDTSPWDRAAGTAGPAWQDLHWLQTDDFEVVDTGAALHDQNQPARNQTPPVATLETSAVEISLGQPVSLTPRWSGKSLACLTPVGHVLKAPRAIVDRPLRDAWYQLEVANPLGRTRVVKRVLVKGGPRRFARYDRYIGTSGSLANDGLSASSPWPVDVLQSADHRHLVAGFVLGVLDGTYDLSGLKSSDYDVPLLQIPTGAFGRPTVLQAVNSRRAVFAGGSNERALLGSRYQGLSHIQIIGLQFSAPSAQHATYFTGDGAFLIDDCEFSAFQISAIRATRVSAPLVRGNRVNNRDTSWLMRLDACSDVLLSGNTLAQPGREWDDYGGGNSVTVVRESP